MDELDRKLNEIYPGKVVRKDLLHQIKKGTNVPSFVLEFLLAKYCATEDAEEIEAGKLAVFETIEKNYVRPDQANKAQSMVQQKGKHKFIDKVHVRYMEKEKRHWAEMENFNSRRIAIIEKYYRDNDRILEGGIWAEITVGHNDREEDDYAFYVEELRPIQLSRFDFDDYLKGRSEFTRDEWIDVIIRSIGLELAKCSKRLKFHHLARLFSFVESNYNFIELGPRGTGKSYSFSEFSPYSTLISGGQATTPVLFYNNARRKVGLVGYWDIVAFDEVAGIRIRDQDSIQIMKDFMANGRFSRGVEVIANASLAFVGNIDYSIDQLVNSSQFDLFYPLPDNFDLAVIDRFHYYLPGWEMPKNSSDYLTENYGFITDYMAEAFHHLFMHTNKYDWVNNHIKLGPSIEGRDEVAIKKTVCALLKLLHPVGEPAPSELDEYIEYAVEGRRRVKEQLNKRKTDEEFANINLSFYTSKGTECTVFCPESKASTATQIPERKKIDETAGSDEKKKGKNKIRVVKIQKDTAIIEKKADLSIPNVIGTPELKEQHFRIFYGSTGNSYEFLFGEYLKNAKEMEIEDPYIRSNHQISNFLRLCELAVKTGSIQNIRLITGYDDKNQKKEAEEKFDQIAFSLKDNGIEFRHSFNTTIHDRLIKLDNGWCIKIGRGLDIYQKPESWFDIGATDMELRPCLETIVDIFKWK